jgi:uncharacterized membrane protein YqhA
MAEYVFSGCLMYLTTILNRIYERAIMKNWFRIMRLLINVIAFFVLVSGMILTLLGVFHFVMVFFNFNSDSRNIPGMMAIGLLHAVDLFLVAVVFYVLAIGMLVLFADPEEKLPVKLPEWLHVKNFVELKVILWEAILTTLVVYYIAGLAEKKIEGGELSIYNLILPGAVLLIAVSLFFLKKGE